MKQLFAWFVVLVLAESSAAAQNISLDAQVRKSIPKGLVALTLASDVFTIGPGTRVNVLADGKLADEDVLVIVSGPFPYITLMTSAKTAAAVHRAHQVKLVAIQQDTQAAKLELTKELCRELKKF
jgi:hypothetical protein